MEKVQYDGTEYIENIAYNAKGQRLLITFGNNIMTRYLYDNRTFRLLRQRSEKYVRTQAGNSITYTPQSGTNKQDDKYIYDLIGNILTIHLNTTACGIGGTDSLNREFDYDPLYRLLSATGRENIQSGSYPFPGWDDQIRSSDPNTTQAYTRKYAYDKVGNVQQIKQLGTSGFTRDFNYVTTKNKLNDVEIALNNYNFTYDNTGNQLTENTERHFEWDAGNRLILFKNQVGSSEPSVIAQYLYDSAGNRVKKIVRKQGGDYEIRTYIDGIFEHYTDETDEQNTVHIIDDQSRVANIRIGDDMGDITPAIKYNLENNIYSSMVVLDDVGSIVNTQEYYPFGETSFGSYAKKRYQYVGKERDEESGLYYYGARYYAPWIARFISCDPLSAQYAQLSPYNYSDNNPINDYDIDGMQNNNTEGSEQGGAPPPNTIEINISKDSRNAMSAYLPKTAADKQRIDLVDPDSSLKNLRYTNVYDSEKGMWKTTMEYEGQLNTDNGIWIEGWAEENINELSLNFSGNTSSQAVNSSTTTIGQIIKTATIIGQVKITETLKEINTVSKVTSNDTVGKVITGGGLVSRMVETAAEGAKKEVISEAKKANKTLVRNKVKAKLPRAWKKQAKALSVVKKVAERAGSIFGVVDVAINFVNAIKVGSDKDASPWKKAGAWLNFAASVVSIGIKATPWGFALSLGITAFTSWWNK